MKAKFQLIFLLLLLSIPILKPSPVFGQFNVLETNNLRLIYYSKGHEYIIQHLARCFENALRFHENLFQFQPTEKVTIIVQDFSDYGHGGAESVPRNFITIGIAPFNYVYETMPGNERLNWMMNHEVAHIATMDKAVGSDNFFRLIFLGKVYPDAEQPLSIFYSYLTNPRRYAPRWYHEGIAVFLETWMAGGMGRALGAYDEMVFRTSVRDSAHIYDYIGLESEGTAIDFQVGVISYLYGTRFDSYLAYKYGPEKLIQWYDRAPGSKKYFSNQFRNIYHSQLDQEWSQWIEWERQWQRDNLQRIRRNPTTAFRIISPRALGSVSRVFYDSTRKKIYCAVLYPGEITHITEIDLKQGSFHKICEIRGPSLYNVTSLAFDPGSSSLFFTTDNNLYRDIYRVSIKDGKKERLLKDCRIGDLAFNLQDHSLWGVRHYNGISSLVRIPYPYQKWNLIYAFPYGKDIFDLDISPDGTELVTALAEISGQQLLIRFNIPELLQGIVNQEVIFDFEQSTPENFSYSPDAKFLFGSSYYSGVSNIYRYDLEQKDMSILSNCESGFFRPLYYSPDSLIVMRYTGEGFTPVMIANRSIDKVSAIRFLGNEIAKKYEMVKEWTIASPRNIHLDSLIISSGSYYPIKNLGLVSAYPIVEGYKVYSSLGYCFNFFDPLGLNGLKITTSISPQNSLENDERFHIGADFGLWPWKFRASYNRADFYDLFGPTRTSRKGYSLSTQYHNYLIFDEPKTLDYTIQLAGYSGLERLPDYQNVSLVYDQFLSLSASLNYQYLQASLGAVDFEKGIKWDISGYSNVIKRHFFPRFYTNLDYGFPALFPHSALWLRSSLGYSVGEREETLANFYFGGFGNNWIDYQSIKRFREYYSFPGVEINRIGGTNYAKIQAEWILPPLRFRRLGKTSVYSNWMRTALFTTGIITNLDDTKYQDRYFNLGLQIDFRIVIFSYMNTTFSLGYALAWPEDQKPATEFMISLKIL